MEHTYDHTKHSAGYIFIFLRVVIVLTLLLLLTASSANATCCYSTSNGSWENGSTWSTGTVPGCGDTIIILASHTVTVSSNNYTLNSCTPVVIEVYGVLHFGSGRKLNLSCGSSVTLMNGSPAGQLTAAGGGGASNQLNICDQTVWQADQGNQSGPKSFNVPLPVTMLYIKVERVDDANLISWATSSEINNAHYDIDRSTDGRTFSKLGRIEGNGTTSNLNEYHFADVFLNAEEVYYRLSQVDYDGTTRFYDLVTMKGLEMQESLFLFPNPSKGKLYLKGQLDRTMHMKAYDMNGRLLSSRIFEPGFPDMIDLEKDCKQGCIMVNITDDLGNNVLRQLVVIEKE